MDAFNYHDSQLYVEELPVSRVAAHFGTPCYIYSAATLRRHFHAFADPLSAWPHQICYAVKANSNLAILKLLADLGSGFDVVSEGELRRVLAAGGMAQKTIFSGVGKSESEIRFALGAKIQCINLESEPELERVAAIAADMQIKAPIAIRVNPDVDANTHPYIATGLKENKFGVEMGLAEHLCQRAHQLSSVELMGIGCHIGSQLLSVDPFIEALERVLALHQRLSQAGIHIKHLDLGGGLGVPYQDEQPPSPQTYIEAILDKLSAYALSDVTLMLEPGRAIAANAGIIVTQVEYIKHTSEKRFVIVDAAMNDLLRPSLYSAWQAIIPVKQRTDEVAEVCDIVGPVCETGDFLGKDRTLAVHPADLLAIRTAGAYGFTMSSNYNTRNRAAEVLVDGKQAYLIRQRETIADQIRLENASPEGQNL